MIYAEYKQLFAENDHLVLNCNCYAMSHPSECTQLLYEYMCDWVCILGKDEFQSCIAKEERGLLLITNQYSCSL